MYGNYYAQPPYYGYPVMQQQATAGAMPDQLAQLRAQPKAQPTLPDERIWVQGEVGAKAYLVAPGNTVPLWDSEQQVIYLKSVNAVGIPVMQKLSYTIDSPSGEKPTNISTGDYVTRAEFEKRLAELLAPKKQQEEADTDVR